MLAIGTVVRDLGACLVVLSSRSLAVFEVFSQYVQVLECVF